MNNFLCRLLKAAVLTAVIASAAMAQGPLYVITGSGTSFTATKDGGATTVATNQSIQNVIDAIKADANGTACSIQFGDGTNTLNIGANNVSFNDGTNDDWGKITLSGSLTSTYAASSTQGTIHLTGGVWVESQANISNTSSGSNVRVIYVNTETDMLTVNGGTISAVAGRTIHNEAAGTVNIAKGTVSTTSGYAAYNNSSGAVNVTGGTISATTGYAIFNQNTSSSGTVTITGGIVTATSGYAIYNQNTSSSGTVNISGGIVSTATGTTIYHNTANSGRVTISSTAIVTSATTGSNSTISVAAAGQLEITGGTVLNTSTGRAITNSSTGAVSISGGAISTNSGVTIYNSATGAMNISGGVISADTNNVVRNNAGGTIIISGGQFASNKYAVIFNGGAGTIDFKGGTVEAYTHGIANNSTGTINISGGTVSAASSSAYGIQNYAGGTINITDVTVSVVSGNAVYNNAGGTINISGGTVYAASSSANAIQNYAGGTITISDSVTVTLGRTASGYPPIAPRAVYNNGTGTIKIIGGTIANTNTTSSSTSAYAVYSGNANAKIELGGDPAMTGMIGVHAGKLSVISDGTEFAFDPGDDKKYTVHLLSPLTNDVVVVSGGGGYLSNFELYNSPSYKLKGINGNLQLTLGSFDVANDGNKNFTLTAADAGQYSTIADAIDAIKDAADGDGCTIRFGANGAEEPLNIGSENITFDGNGSGDWGKITLLGKITSANSNSSLGTIRLTNGVSVESQAEVANTYGAADGRAIYINSATDMLTISGGTVSAASGRAIHNQADGEVNISGGTVSTTNGSYAIYNNASGTMNINGGTVSTTNGSYAIYNNAGGTININGGTVSASSQYAIYNSYGGTININDGNVSANYYTVQNGSNGTVNITGGTVSANSYNTVYNSGSNGTVNITGGTISSSYSTTYNSSYGTIYNSSSSGTINISGGTISAVTDAAVYNYYGTVNISGSAEITSANPFAASGALYGSYAYSSSPGIINITGGTVRNTAGGFAAYCYNEYTTVQLGGDPDIQGGIRVYAGKLSVNTDNTDNIPDFEPAGGKKYTVELASYSMGAVVVVNGAGYAGNFELVTADGMYSLAAGSGAEASLLVLSLSDGYITVTYDINGGVGGIPPAQAVQLGDGITLANGNGLTKSSFVFAGWNTDASGTGTNYNAGSLFTPEGDITLYAKWASVYTVTFDAGDGDVTPASGTTGAEGTLASLPTPTRNGYIFGGWFTAETGGDEVTTNTVFSANAVIYAKWEWTPTVTFNASGGSVTPASGTTGADGTLASLPTPTRNSDIFGGWFTAETGGEEVTTNTVFSADAVIYARWIPVYTVTFNAGDGTFNQLSETFENGANGWVTVNGTQPNYWVRGGNTKYNGSYSTYITNDGSINGYNNGAASTVHIYKDVTFPTSSSDFTLTFQFKGSGESSYDYMTVRYSAPNSTPTSGSVFSGGTPVGTNYNLTPNWTKKTITLPAAAFSGKTMRLVFTWINDGSAGSQPPAAIDDIYIGTQSTTDMIGIDRTLASLPTPTRDGYIFGGWFTAETGGEEVTTNTVFDADAVIYAKWTVDSRVNVQVPSITAQPAGKTVTGGTANTAYDLTVAAANVTAGTLTYQWYSNSVNSNTGGTAIIGATNNVYSAPTDENGVFYYYVIVTNTIDDNGDGGVKSASDTSNVATLTVDMSAHLRPLYVITPGGGSGLFNVARDEQDGNGPVVFIYNSPISGAITAIKAFVGNEDCSIQFGADGAAEPLNIGSDNITFNGGLNGNDWGNITLYGKITSASSGQLIFLTNGVSIESMADITNTNGYAIGISNANANTAVTLKISGGIINAVNRAIYVSTALAQSPNTNITITGGTVSAGTAIYNDGVASINVSGGTVRGGSSAILGGAVSGSVSIGNAVPTAYVTVSGTAVVTSASESYATIYAHSSSGHSAFGYMNVTISGGTVSNTATGSNARALSNTSEQGRTYITNGNISAAGLGTAVYFQVNGSNYLYISGGNITAEAGNAVYNDGGWDVSISGATISARSGSTVFVRGGTTTIYSGTISAEESGYAIHYPYDTRGTWDRITVRGDTKINGRIKVPYNTLSFADDFVPEPGKKYTLELPFYNADSVAVGVGADFSDAFELASPPFAYRLFEDNYSLVIAKDDGTEQSPYRITTPQELAKFAELVNADSADAINGGKYAEKHYKLYGDIDLSAYGRTRANNDGWTPIGTSTNPFRGTFDGSGNTINGLYINRPTEDYIGLFGYLGRDDGDVITIKDVTVTGTSITGRDYTGSLAGYVGGDFEGDINISNCNVSISGNVEGGLCVGGLLGYGKRGNIGIDGSSFVGGKVKGGGFDNGYGKGVGGLLGAVDDGNITVSNSRVAADTIFSSEGGNIGGLVGNLSKWDPTAGVTQYVTVDISHSSFSGTVVSEGSSNSNNVGGILGLAYSFVHVAIDYCEFDGTLSGSNVSVGGLLGGADAAMGDIRISNSRVSADTISSSQGRVGGLVGSFTGANSGSDGSIEIRICSATGNVIGKGENVGGLIGFSLGAMDIENCSAAGNVIGDNQHVGGLVGSVGAQSSYPVTIDYCKFEGAVDGTSRVGGIVGVLEVGSVTNCYSTGNVTGTGASSEYIGGIVGQNAAGSSGVEKCYATGAVSGGSYVGGIVGWNFNSVENCAALNTSVSATLQNAGRVAGNNNSTLLANVAFIGILNGSNTTNWSRKGATDIDGADISAASIYANPTMGTRFSNTAVWTTEVSKLPGFVSAEVTPPHLIPDFSAADITLNPVGPYYYTGTPLTPSVASVVLDGETLTDITHYVLVGYAGNDAVGTATVTVRGVGDLASSTASKNFTIEPSSAPVDAETPTIGTQPTGGTYTQGAAAAALSVSASVADGGTLSYQWYSNTAGSTTGGTAVGTNANTYTPSTSTAGTLYYYVVVTNTLGNKSASVASGTAKVTVTVESPAAAAPVIGMQPVGAKIPLGGNHTTRVSARAADGGRLSYQWYNNKSYSNRGGTKIPGATNDTYTMSINSRGMFYYYAEVTNTIDEDGDTVTASTMSKPIRVMDDEEREIAGVKFINPTSNSDLEGKPIDSAPSNLPVYNVKVMALDQYGSEYIDEPVNARVSVIIDGVYVSKAIKTDVDAGEASFGAAQAGVRQGTVLTYIAALTSKGGHYADTARLMITEPLPGLTPKGEDPEPDGARELTGVKFISPTSNSDLEGKPIDSAPSNLPVYNVKVMALDRHGGGYTKAPVNMQVSVMLGGVYVLKAVKTDAKTGMASFDVSQPGVSSGSVLTFVVAALAPDGARYTDTARLAITGPVSESAPAPAVIEITQQNEASAMAPVSLSASEFTAGPNPVYKKSGKITFYRRGNRAVDGELRIYDVTGNVVSRVTINDRESLDLARRKVGVWDLMDRNGRQVSEGTYLVRGVVKTSDGKKENVSVIVGVR